MTIHAGIINSCQPEYALQFISPFASGLSVGQTRVIAVSFPSMRYVLTQSLNFPRAFVVVGYKVKDVTDVHGADEPIDFHEPDWHWPPCQSGVWRTSGSSNGSYSNLGSHRGSFTGRNTGSGTLFVYASGGNGGSAGGDCANTSRLQGYVAGALISTNASNNPSYGKTAFISFAVPAGATYQITSYPAQNYSCGSGVFSVFGYQT